MKVSIPTKMIFIGLIIALTIFGAWKVHEVTRPVTDIEYKGITFSFRDDVNKAQKIETNPSERFIYDMFWDYRTENITILFKAGTPKTNGLLQAEVFELVYKLTVIYKNSAFGRYGLKHINAEEIDSYDNITRSDDVFKIILVPPEFSDRTEVLGGGNKVYIYGKNNKDFDLAVIKTILIAMGIGLE